MKTVEEMLKLEAFREGFFHYLQPAYSAIFCDYSMLSVHARTGTMEYSHAQLDALQTLQRSKKSLFTTADLKKLFDVEEDNTLYKQIERLRQLIVVR